MSNSKSYKENWSKIEEIGGGGQGTTLKVQATKDSAIVGVAKVLNKQNDMDRRKRMHREATSLITLDHPNLPKVLDSNTENYADLDFKLFIVTDYIPGPTLSQVDFSKSSLEEKANLFRQILETLNYCHHRGIIHRDIKPDNIILRNGNFNEPVILDFGLSFNFNEKDNDGITPDGEQIGNRFLILPEQKKGETGKRDFKSDISCAVGLFFFFLTGIQPITPVDEHSRKPHQREDAQKILQTIPEHQLAIINHIFDTGFELIIGKRWQSIESVLEQLDILEMSKPNEVTSEKEIIASIRKNSAKQEFRDREFLYALFDEVDKSARSVLDELRTELGDRWGMIQGGYSKTFESYSNTLAPSNAIVGFTGKTRIEAFATGSELVVKIIEGDEKKEAYRAPLEGDKSWVLFKERLKDHYLKQIRKHLSV